METTVRGPPTKRRRVVKLCLEGDVAVDNTAEAILLAQRLTAMINEVGKKSDVLWGAFKELEKVHKNSQWEEVVGIFDSPSVKLLFSSYHTLHGIDQMGGIGQVTDELLIMYNDSRRQWSKFCDAILTTGECLDQHARLKELSDALNRGHRDIVSNALRLRALIQGDVLIQDRVYAEYLTLGKCPICSDKWEVQSESTVRLPCNHPVHVDCIECDIDTYECVICEAVDDIECSDCVSGHYTIDAIDAIASVLSSDED